MEVLVKNEVKELAIVDPKSGCNWEQDLIGGCDGFDGYDDVREMYTMEPETFKWWVDYIEIETDLQNRAKEVRDELDNDDQQKFDQAMIDAGSSDMDQMQQSQIQAVEEWKQKENDQSK